MQKSLLLAALQSEIHRHDCSTFVDEPPTMAQGGKEEKPFLSAP
jgi:hypothetical protein